MITGLDHIVLLARDIGAAVLTYETLLAQKVAWRTQGDGAETAIFTLANMSLEIMAPSGDGATGARVRARLDEQGEGLASLCFRVNGIEKFQRRLKRLGLAPEDVAESGSTSAIDGAKLAWKRTRTAVETTHGVRLFFLEMATARPVSQVDRDRTHHRPRPCRDLDRGAGTRGSALRSATRSRHVARSVAARLGRAADVLPLWRSRGRDRAPSERRKPRQARQSLGPQLARDRHRRRAGAACGSWTRCHRSPNRPASRNACLHGA